MITEREAYALYDQVKQHRDEILADADRGDLTAKAIVSSHDMLVRFPDQCAYGILEASFERWLEERNAKP